MTNWNETVELTESVQCECCGNEFAVNELIETNDGLVCKKCLENYYTKCYECDEWFKTIEMTYTNSCEYVCERCLNDNYFFCDCCERWYSIDEHNDVSHVDNTSYYCVCDGCFDREFAYCDCCNEITLRWDRTTVEGDNRVCNTCLENDYVFCENCHTYTHEDNSAYSDEDCCWYCQDCYNENCHEGIMGYHCFDKDNYICVGSGKKFYGIELEIESDDENADEVLKHDWLHCERDGSLDDGFEIISQPLSLETWYKYKEFKELTSNLIKNGARSHDTSTCGLHIHVSKKACNNVERIKAIVELFYTEIVKLARRKNNSYCRYISERYIDCDIETIKKECKKGSWDRYVAVNTTNSKTVEFRLFKGTLKHSTILASIELVNNIVEVANSTQTIIHFSDLIKGKYLPAYAKNRKVNLNKTIDISDFINAYALKGGK